MENIYHDNSPKNFDSEDDRVRVNGRTKYDSRIPGNSKPRVRYANLVWGVMRKQSLSHNFL